MKLILPKTFLKFLFIALLFLGNFAFGQIAIPNTTAVTQNFDSMAATTTLPTNWKMAASTASPTWTGASASVTQEASSGTPVQGGTYNFGSSISERAVGAMTSGSFASPNNLLAYFQNTNASNLTSLTISYDAERYRRNTAAASVQFFYSTDGTSWTAVTAGDIATTSFPTGTNTYNFPSGIVVNKTAISITGLSIATNGTIYLRWTINTAGGNSQGIAIDNVSVNAAFAVASTISTTGTLSAVNTTYGSASASTTTFSVSGTGMTGGILVTPPSTNFEVSLSSGSGYANTITVGAAGTIASTPVYVRLKATATVAGSPYSGNIVLSSAGATSVNVGTASSTVAPYVLTVSGASASNKVYNGTNAATIIGATLSAQVNGDVISVTGGGTFATPNAGTGIAVTSTLTLTGTNATSYSLTQPSGLTANITAKPLTITGLTAQNKVYNGTTAATLTGTAVLNGVIVADVSNVTLGGTPVATFASSAVGTGIAVTVTGYAISGSASGNYSVAQPTGLTADITSVAVPVVNSALTFSSVYGTTASTYTITATNSPTSYSATGLPTGLSVNTTNGQITGTPTASVGNYNVTITATNEGGESNPATLVYTITPKTVTASGVTAQNKEYDRTVAAQVSWGSISGIIVSDIGNLTISAAGIFASANVGTGIAVTVALAGSAAGNYFLTPPTVTANITAKAVTITGITVASKEYDGLTAAALVGTATLVGVVSGDEPSVSIVTTVATAAFTTATAGTTKPVTITGYALSGASSGNYTVSQPSTVTGTITAKSVTITGLTANDKVEDGTTAATLSGTPALSGIVSGDEAEVSISGTATAMFATATSGTAIAVSVTGYSLTGTKALNYAVSQPTGLAANITALGIPTATAATSVLSSGFTANWNAVSGATSYELDVYQGSTSPATTITETFTAVGGGTSSSYLTRTWTGEGGITWNAYKARTDQVIVTGNEAVTLRDEAGSFLQSDVITGGVSNISFDVLQFFSGSGGILTVKVLTGAGFSTVTTIGTKLYNDTASHYDSGVITGITGDYKILIENNTSARAGIDNLSFTSLPVSTTTYVTGYNDLDVGNVTSYEVIDLNAETIYHYRVRAVRGGNSTANSNEITVLTKPSTVTWNGTAWSNVDGPDATIDAVLVGPYTTTPNGEIVAKSLSINAGGSLTVTTGDTVVLDGALTNTLTAAEVVVESGGNLYQTIIATNTGEITIKRETSALKKLDYVLWSSPVTGQNLLDFSSATLPNRFYTYDPQSDFYVAVTPSETSFVPTTGYLIRMPNTHPTSPTVWEGTFVGVPNNQDYSLAVTSGTFNAIGNPYPTTMSANDFITGNALTELYFWRKTNNTLSTSYATYTTAGGVSNSGDTAGLEPNGTIQVGQGFIAQATSNTLNITNAMKSNNHDNQFLRTAQIERNRIWLNMTGANGIFGQTMIAYMTGATQGIDAAIDGRYINDSPIALTSMVDNQEFAIQGRSLPFEATDSVALSFKTNIAGNYTFAIDHVDGLFTGAQDIYLRDTVTGLDHDLKAGAYSFSTEAGTFANRFFVVYTAALSVGNPVLNANSIVVYKNDNQSFTVNSGTVTMASVKVFDIRGRLLTTQNNINGTQTIITAGQSNEVVLVQVTSIDGATVTKKVVR